LTFTFQHLPGVGSRTPPTFQPFGHISTPWRVLLCRANTEQACGCVPLRHPPLPRGCGFRSCRIARRAPPSDLWRMLRRELPPPSGGSAGGGGSDECRIRSSRRRADGRFGCRRRLQVQKLQTINTGRRAGHRRTKLYPAERDRGRYRPPGAHARRERSVLTLPPAILTRSSLMTTETKTRSREGDILRCGRRFEHERETGTQKGSGLQEL
jgi:hypothetical protein